MIGIGTTSTPHFQEWKESQPKEPTGSGKKRYVVSCISPSDWTDIHTVLMKDGTLEDNIPSDIVECSDNKLHSSTRGTYKLTDAEASDLRKHSKVRCVDIDTAFYAGTYAPDPAILMDSIVQKERYAATVKNIRGNASSYLPTTPNSADKNRAGYQLLRCKQKDNAWGNNVNQVLNDKLASYGDGSDVDCIVADQAAWLGHIEFQNNLGGPAEYSAKNVLDKKGVSSTSGTCDVLDLVLDAPYYIDPDWFNNDAANKLTTRWDGTTVPVEQHARAWWEDASKRSAAFSGIGVVGSINSGYNRANSNGSNIASHSAGSNNYHGTPCASQVYGRQYGFAYNANKWYINAYGSYGTGVENYFDITKIFHQNKPLNPTKGDKDPTVTSNSFGYRKDLPVAANYFYRVGLTGHIEVSYSIGVTAAGSGAYTLSGNDKSGSVSGNNATIAMNAYDTITFNVNASGHPFFIKTSTGTGTGNQAAGVTNNGSQSGTVTFRPTAAGTYYYQCQYHGAMVGTINVAGGQASGVNYTSGNAPGFMDNFSQGAIRFEYSDNSMTIAGDEMIDAGVIFVCSSGNTNQKLVKHDHPDYNNYYSTVSADATYLNSYSNYYGLNAYNSINRQGFPGQIGKQVDNIAGITTYRTIPVGAMDPSLQSTSGTGQERKVSYSNMGNLVPYYAPAADTLAATDENNYPRYNRFDAYYTLNSAQSYESEDCLFGGTSSACPVSCGLIATKLQYNRTWKVGDVMDWITNSVGTQSISDFYRGTEATTPNGASFSDVWNIQGGNPIIIWDATTGNETEDGDDKVAVRLKNAGDLKMTGINFINT
tara:strand:+ start:10300 stop:12759 length:2460 start_codon:yes stop_codon:yes gene_type:complete